MNRNKLHIHRQLRREKLFINWFVYLFVVCMVGVQKGIKEKKKKICRKFSFKLFENKTTTNYYISSPSLHNKRQRFYTCLILLRVTSKRKRIIFMYIYRNIYWILACFTYICKTIREDLKKCSRKIAAKLFTELHFYHIIWVRIVCSCEVKKWKKNNDMIRGVVCFCM